MDVCGEDATAIKPSGSYNLKSTKVLDNGSWSTLSKRQKNMQAQDSDTDDDVPQAETPVEISDDSGGNGDGNQNVDSDGGYASASDASASSSLASTARDYQFENGRRFHSFHAGAYLFPNDEQEQEREDMKHGMIVKLCDGKLHYAPVENPQRTIDVGTGTGVWAIDMGDEYPSAEILGIDLSPIQPIWVPPNVRFMVDDAESPWLHPDNHFDYVHIRHLASAIKDFPKLFQVAYQKLKPGGWIEIQDLYYRPHSDDNTIPEDYAYSKWLGLLQEGLARYSVDLLAPPKYADYLRDAGFRNVSQRLFKVPIGVWPKDKTLKKIGLYNRCMIVDGLQGSSMKPFNKGLGWALEEIAVFNVGVRKAVEDSSVHAYLPFYVVFAQKPRATG
ncbi:hypothetical protein AJ79_08081 [Helicocarpus griseus UAMH5409]|uniref:Methyltransferase domain-containing protein n=1 Tax=Helicocarpus griseus UAMH5409 TaxID=1447875 RepID=A0A2B7WW64_9EURO|nr:hypothetical protein AJ79_08081 [Helicocarpus griseus UAMH5409]